jgi:hypothetical protein
MSRQNVRINRAVLRHVAQRIGHIDDIGAYLLTCSTKHSIRRQRALLLLLERIDRVTPEIGWHTKAANRELDRIRKAYEAL